MTALSQEEKRRKRIRELNDAFRRTFTGGRVVLTAGFNALPDHVKQKALAAHVAPPPAHNGPQHPPLGAGGFDNEVEAVPVCVAARRLKRTNLDRAQRLIGMSALFGAHQRHPTFSSSK